MAINDKDHTEMGLPCEQEQNITEIKEMVGGLTKEFRGLLQEMRTIFVEDREHKIKIEQLEKGQEILYNKLRNLTTAREICVRDKIDPLVEWKNRMDGSLSALKVVPIVCVIITTLMAVFTFMDKVHPSPQYEFYVPADQEDEDGQ